MEPQWKLNVVVIIFASVIQLICGQFPFRRPYPSFGFSPLQSGFSGGQRFSEISAYRPPQSNVGPPYQIPFGRRQGQSDRTVSISPRPYNKALQGISVPIVNNRDRSFTVTKNKNQSDVINTLRNERPNVSEDNIRRSNLGQHRIVNEVLRSINSNRQSSADIVGINRPQLNRAHIVRSFPQAQSRNTQNAKRHDDIGVTGGFSQQHGRNINSNLPQTKKVPTPGLKWLSQRRRSSHQTVQGEQRKDKINKTPHEAKLQVGNTSIHRRLPREHKTNIGKVTGTNSNKQMTNSHRNGPNDKQENTIQTGRHQHGGIKTFDRQTSNKPSARGGNVNMNMRVPQSGGHKIQHNSNGKQGPNRTTRANFNNRNGNVLTRNRGIQIKLLPLKGRKAAQSHFNQNTRNSHHLNTLNNEQSDQRSNTGANINDEERVLESASSKVTNGVPQSKNAVNNKQMIGGLKWTWVGQNTGHDATARNNKQIQTKAIPFNPRSRSSGAVGNLVGKSNAKGSVSIQKNVDRQQNAMPKTYSKLMVRNSLVGHQGNLNTQAKNNHATKTGRRESVATGHPQSAVKGRTSRIVQSRRGNTMDAATIQRMNSMNVLAQNLNDAKGRQGHRTSVNNANGQAHGTIGVRLQNPFRQMQPYQLRGLVQQNRQNTNSRHLNTPMAVNHNVGSRVLPANQYKKMSNNGIIYPTGNDRMVRILTSNGPSLNGSGSMVRKIFLLRIRNETGVASAPMVKKNNKKGNNNVEKTVLNRQPSVVVRKDESPERSRRLNEAFQQKTSIRRLLPADNNKQIGKDQFNGRQINSLTLPFERLSLKYPKFLEAQRLGLKSRFKYKTFKTDLEMGRIKVKRPPGLDLLGEKRNTNKYPEANSGVLMQKKTDVPAVNETPHANNKSKLIDEIGQFIDLAAKLNVDLSKLLDEPKKSPNVKPVIIVPAKFFNVTKPPTTTKPPASKVIIIRKTVN